VFIVTYVDVVNKRRQIGIQRAIGISSMTILLAYALRAIFYMVLGSALGILAFLYIVVPLEAKYPFHFPQGSVLLAINNVFMVKMVGLLLDVGLISALIPAYRSIRIKIIDAIWSN
jgi:putative ABC transport system permease protein